MPILRPPSLRYLARLPQGGWGVRIRVNGITFQRSFDVFPGRDEAESLELACAWRDATLMEHPHIPLWRSTERALIGKLPTGIQFEAGSRGNLGQYHVTTPLTATVMQSRSFSLLRYGRSRAKELAVFERERQLRLMVKNYLDERATKAVEPVTAFQPCSQHDGVDPFKPISAASVFPESLSS